MTHLYEVQDWSWVAKASKRALERGLKYDFKESLIVFSCIIFALLHVYTVLKISN